MNNNKNISCRKYISNNLVLRYRSIEMRKEQTMANIYTSVEQLIGKTPLMKLTNIEKKI